MAEKLKLGATNRVHILRHNEALLRAFLQRHANELGSLANNKTEPLTASQQITTNSKVDPFRKEQANIYQQLQTILLSIQLQWPEGQDQHALVEAIDSLANVKTQANPIELAGLRIDDVLEKLSGAFEALKQQKQIQAQKEIRLVKSFYQKNKAILSSELYADKINHSNEPISQTLETFIKQATPYLEGRLWQPDFLDRLHKKLVDILLDVFSIIRDKWPNTLASHPYFNVSLQNERTARLELMRDQLRDYPKDAPTAVAKLSLLLNTMTKALDFSYLTYHKNKHHEHAQKKKRHLAKEGLRHRVSFSYCQEKERSQKLAEPSELPPVLSH